MPQEGRRGIGQTFLERLGRKKGRQEMAAGQERVSAGQLPPIKRGNRQILVLTYGISIVFLCMAGYLAYFMAFKSQQVINNPYNKRQEVLARKVRKGDIVSADGKVLAETVTDQNGNETRYYPYGEMFCHIVGRSENSMTGIEGRQCYPLLTSHANPLKRLTNALRGEKNRGDTVVTTLNYDLQKTAYQALNGRKGAIVAIEPSTGKILAMVSMPAYNPNSVRQDWETLISGDDEESPLVNRATQGLYAPGSTFKVLVAIEYILEHPNSYPKFRYTCSGSDVFDGNVINCYGHERHGELDLESALAKSCNSAFAKIGTLLDVSSFGKLTEKFLFNQSLPVDFEYNRSKFSLDKKADTGEVTQTAIGQGKTMITPLENAMIAQTIANQGEMLTPYAVDHLENEAGQTVIQYAPDSLGKKLEQKTVKTIAKMMQLVITDGTGASLADLPYHVAGKTGSAEFDSAGNSHAWFIGYAPAKNPKIAVSIIVEGAGTGSRYAVPIAKQLFGQYLS